MTSPEASLALACCYGFALGGYQYTLKLFLYEKVRSKRFPWAWAWQQAGQGPGLALLPPLSTLLDTALQARSTVVLSRVTPL